MRVTEMAFRVWCGDQFRPSSGGHDYAGALDKTGLPRKYRTSFTKKKDRVRTGPLWREALALADFVLASFPYHSGMLEPSSTRFPPLRASLSISSHKGGWIVKGKGAMSHGALP